MTSDPADVVLGLFASALLSQPRIPDSGPSLKRIIDGLAARRFWNIMTRTPGSGAVEGIATSHKREGADLK